MPLMTLTSMSSVTGYTYVVGERLVGGFFTDVGWNLELWHASKTRQEQVPTGARL